MKKGGLEFFPLDCQLDDKFELLEAEFGIKSFGIIIKLFQKIYSGEGYFCQWSDEIAMVFSKHIGVELEYTQKIVNRALERGIFLKNKFKKYGILTSNGIQMRFLSIVKRRKEILLNHSYLTDDVNNYVKTANIKEKKADNFEENVSSFKQSKVKESKAEESKGKYARTWAAPKNKFNNYIDTNKTDYTNVQENLIAEALKE